MKIRAGFTLLELLVVVAIVGVLGTLGVVNLPRDRIQVREAARIVAADILRVRSEAILRNVPVALTFSPATGSYRAYTDELRDRVPDDGRFIFERQLTAEFPLATIASVTFTDGDTLWFDVRGLPQSSTGGFSSGNTVVRAQGDGGYRLRIVMANQGRVRTEVF